MANYELYQVDAFTSQAFRANPAAVVLVDSWPSDAVLADIAAEMNLSETAFVGTPDNGARALRWFTPTVEVDLCGHATLASAHLLWETGRLGSGDAAFFDTRSGRLGAAQLSEGWIELDFPSLVASPVDAPANLLASLGVAEDRPVWRSRFDYLVDLPDADAVTAVRPDFALLAAVDARVVIVTASAPAAGAVLGVDEDPVTGSAHCVLAPL